MDQTLKIPSKWITNLIFTFTLFFSTFTISHSLNADGLSLLALKSAISSDPTRILASWSESDPNPCRWVGVSCSRQQRVTQLSLSDKNLTGYIPSELGLLDSIQKLLLAHNNFYGPVPHQIASLKSLNSLDLSSNSLNGSLPEGLFEFGDQNLVGGLNLSCNLFTGDIPASYGSFPPMVSLDLRRNNLTGKIPQVGSLLNQGPTAFAGNPFLCGFPVQNSCPEDDPISIKPPENPKNPIKPDSRPDPEIEAHIRGKENVKTLALPIICGVSVLFGLLSVSLWFFHKKKGSDEGKSGKEKDLNVVCVHEEGQNGKFVALDEGFNLELEDLLRASAYVVGKSKGGIVYRVVAGSGATSAAVAVRRLSENDATWKFKEFEAEVEATGRVQHPNIVRLRAYYYANDEKLLVSDFIANGSLYFALHGGPSNSSTPLSWPARLMIAQGIARGMAHIHECSPRKYVHGNIKSSKILLDNDLNPYISGFGLTRLISPTTPTLKKQNSNQSIVVNSITASKITTTSSVAYIAPEARAFGTRLTQRCDVYSFGIVLMEILSGKIPDPGPDNDNKGLEGLVRKVFREELSLSEIIDLGLLHEVYAKKQVITAFHVALNCTELDPELRPRMRMVSESLDRIRSQ